MFYSFMETNRQANFQFSSNKFQVNYVWFTVIARTPSHSGDAAIT